MMRIIYATGNPGKLRSMREYLDGLLTVAGLDEYGVDIDVDESGVNPLENARIKAEAYYGVLKEPVLAADSGLYIDGLAEDEQPGVHVRRVGGRRLSDGEMIAHYAAIAARLGGRARARYVNGLCVIAGPARICQTSEPVFGSDPFDLVDRPHATITEGHPLDSISVEIASGMYYYDLTERRPESMFRRQAYRDFVMEALTGLSEAEYASAMRRAGASVGSKEAADTERRLLAALAEAYARPGSDLKEVSLNALSALP